MTTIHHYDGATGEYLASSQARIDPLQGGPLIPANATTTAPPNAAQGCAVCFVNNVWQQIENHRCELLYSIETGLPVTWSALGAIPQGHTASRPGANQVWDHTTQAWTDDPETMSSARVMEIHAEFRDLDLASIRPLRAMQAGQGTSEDGTVLADIETQVQILRTELATLTTTEE